MRTKWRCHRRHHHHRWHQQLTLFWTFSTYQTATIHTCLTVITPTLRMRKVSLREFQWLCKSLGLVSAAHSRKPDSLWLKHIEAYFSCIRILDVHGLGVASGTWPHQHWLHASWIMGAVRLRITYLYSREGREWGGPVSFSCLFLSGKQKLF